MLRRHLGPMLHPELPCRAQHMLLVQALQLPLLPLQEEPPMPRMESLLLQLQSC